MSEIERVLATAATIGQRAGQRAAEGRWAQFALHAGTYPVLAVRSAVDRAWVDAQLAKRSAWVRRVAEMLGLDPDEAERRWRAGSLNLEPGG